MAAHRKPAGAVLGSAALGLNLLTRVTTGLDLMAGGIFLLLVLWFEQCPRTRVVAAVSGLLQGCGSGLCVFSVCRAALQLLPLRISHQTYMPIFAREPRLQDPTLPANFPWSTPSTKAFWGRSSSRRSRFFSLILCWCSRLCCSCCCGGLVAEVRAYALTSLLLLARLYQFLCAVYVLGGRLRLG